MPENEKQPSGQKKKFELRDIFFHNTFALVFSFLLAIICWFIMAAGNEEAPRVVYDVPISVKLSAAAEEDGLRVFNASYTMADISVEGSSVITNRLNADDFEVSATLNPTSTKLTTGNTLQKATLTVKAEKKTVVSDYTISAVNPEEITVEYDRYKEVSFPIEDNVKFSADAGYYAGTPTFSQDAVTISGPESAVNKISRVAAEYTVTESLREDKVVSACSLTLYDQNNQKITDYSGLYLSMSTETIEVVISVVPTKELPVTYSVINGPKSFSNTLISVEPKSITIAAPAETLSTLDELVLPDAIDFSTLDPERKNEFKMEIPIPAGARDITNLGSQSTATVTVNLNGYQKATVTTSNITMTKIPANTVPTLTTKNVEVSLIGSEAQIAKLTGDSVSCTADLSNFAGQTGAVEVPITVSVASGDSCWSIGTYTVYITLSEKTARATMAEAERGPSGGSETAVVATPQE